MRSTDRPPSFAAIILAGGESRRMGRRKEGVLLRDGRPMIEHVADAVRPLGHPLAISGDCRGYSGAALGGLPRIVDLRPGEGPLAALEAILSSRQASAYLVVSCDQPLLSPDLLRLLPNGAPDKPSFFRDGEGHRLDPFPGLFPESLLPSVQAALDTGRRSIRRFLVTVDCRWVPLPPEDVPRLRSFNSMDELRAAGMLPDPH